MYRTVVTICTTMFNIYKFYVLPTQGIYLFCVDLRTNSEPYTTLTDWFYNRDGDCLLRGTDCVIKYRLIRLSLGT
jgi:hypothetical protein